jgi:hypothetical protein
VRVSHRFTTGSARFDEDNLVSDAGLVPLLGLAEQTGLAEILTRKASITTPRISPVRQTRHETAHRGRRNVRRRGQRLARGPPGPRAICSSKTDKATLLSNGQRIDPNRSAWLCAVPACGAW